MLCLYIHWSRGFVETEFPNRSYVPFTGKILDVAFNSSARSMGDSINPATGNARAHKHEFLISFVSKVCFVYLYRFKLTAELSTPRSRLNCGHSRACTVKICSSFDVHFRINKNKPEERVAESGAFHHLWAQTETIY